MFSRGLDSSAVRGQRPSQPLQYLPDAPATFHFTKTNEYSDVSQVFDRGDTPQPPLLPPRLVIFGQILPLVVVKT